MSDQELTGFPYNWGVTLDKAEFVVGHSCDLSTCAMDHNGITVTFPNYAKGTGEVLTIDWKNFFDACKKAVKKEKKTIKVRID